jgi:hypothetical protein
MDYVRLDEKILADKFSRVGGVRQDTANLGCGKENVFGTLLGKELLNRTLISQIKLLMPPQEEVRIASRFELAY